MQTILLNDTPASLNAESDFLRIGLLLLATDLTTERDFARVFAPSAFRLHATRLAYANPVTPENLQAMAPRLAEAASLLPPDTPLVAVYFACASGSVVIGDDAITRAVRSTRPFSADLPVLTPVSAALEALSFLGARRISILTPYSEATSLPVARHFQAQGCDVLSLACLGLDDDRDMARVAPEYLVQAAAQAMHPEAEALFVSCTALRALEVASRMEYELGRPVVTSNQAAAWRILRHCGLAAAKGVDFAPYGQLLQPHFS